MCGLVGLIARKSQGFLHSHMELMQNLLLLDQLRGDDSTGVFTVLKDSNVVITKVGSHPSHLFETASWNKHKTKAVNNGRVMIGHNRKATMGVVNSANAHPFHEDNIVLVHNGTLRGGHKQLADTEVDSHAVCHAFAEKGAEEVLKTLDAAFAFIWWDIEANKLYAVRNDERPLNLVQTPDLNILCSEAWMAEVLCKRATPVMAVERVVPIQAGELYEFSLDGTFTIKSVDLKKITYVETTQWTRRGPSGRYQEHWSEAMDDLEDAKDVKMIGTAGNGTASQCTVTQLTTNSGRIAHSSTPTPSNTSPVVINPFTTNEHYKKEQGVLLKILSCERDTPTKKFKAMGQIIEPGKPVMDFVGYQRINWLMLMMVDPDVHFHVIPRYAGSREHGGASFPDAGWPNPPALAEALSLSDAQLDALTADLAARWVATASGSVIR